MGSILSYPAAMMASKQQEAMAEMQKLQMARQMEMQNIMRERMMAMQVAKAREAFSWIFTGYVTIAGALLAAGLKLRKPALFVPQIPLGLIIGYQYDLAYGSKLIRIRRDAESLLVGSPELFLMPLGKPTFDTVENNRLNTEDEDRVTRPNRVFL